MFWLICYFSGVSCAFTELRTEAFTQSTAEDGSNYLVHRWLPASNYIKYRVLFSSIVRIESATCSSFRIYLYKLNTNIHYATRSCWTIQNEFLSPINLFIWTL